MEAVFVCLFVFMLPGLKMEIFPINLMESDEQKLDTEDTLSTRLQKE